MVDESIQVHSKIVLDKAPPLLLLLVKTILRLRAEAFITTPATYTI